MFVTYKASGITGYSQVSLFGKSDGGGWYYSPSGGGYYGGPCGEPCLFDPGTPDEDKRQTFVSDVSLSYGFCGSSISEKCDRQGYCGTATQKATGVPNIENPYATSTSSTKLFTKLTCLDGLTTTQSSSESPYTKTAEQVCVTSINIPGKDVPLAGAFPTTTKACSSVAPGDKLSLYAGGDFPSMLDSAATGSWCAGSDSNSKCTFIDTCSGCTVVSVTDYDGCGKGFPSPVQLASAKTATPCPFYYTPGECENAYILSNTGNYIQASSSIGPFKTASVYALSIDKAVTFPLSSGSSSPKREQAFSYSNDEVKYTALKGKQSTYTNSYIWVGEDGASTSTSKANAGGYEAGTDLVALFYSGEVKCTQKGVVWKTTGPGANPCCAGGNFASGTNCTSDEVSEATTDTISAGESFEFTHAKTSTTQLGEYVAYQATTIGRKDHLAWGEFAYSTSAGDQYASQDGTNDEYQCVIPMPAIKGEVLTSYNASVDKVFTLTGEKCVNCAPGNYPVEIMTTKNFPADCPALNCGCASASGFKTQQPGNTSAITQCVDPCGKPTPCTRLDDFGETACCIEPAHEMIDQPAKTIQAQIARQGNCKIVGKTSLSMAYTHLTRVQTLTTGIDFGDDAFQVTLKKSEGLYFFSQNKTDSKASRKTATSYSLKQSKSDIAHSHVTFAFDGEYYNPMGRTTQFGSDGAAKTFIALATGDATYLKGSPSGNSSKDNSTTSHDGNVHSYYISDPAEKNWNQASWPGHGVVNGKITTGTFSFSFNTGVFKNSYGGAASLARFLPGAQQTIVAHGGLNLISSKDDVSEKSFKTTYSTQAFSTSFDSSYKGAWIAKAVPYTCVATKSVGDPMLAFETDHIRSACVSSVGPELDEGGQGGGCNFPQPEIPIPLIGDTTAYFDKGDKSLVYNKHAASYLWTHPAFKKVWGDGHGAYCEE